MFCFGHKWRYDAKGALQLIHKCGLWKGDPDFTLVFQKPSVYRAPFPIISTFTCSRYDVIELFPLGGAASDLWIWILNPECVLWWGYHNLILVFNSNYTSISHRFLFFQVLPLAGKWRHSVICARGRCRQILNLAYSIYFILLWNSYIMYNMKKDVNQPASNFTKSSNSETSKRSLENSRRPSLIIRTLRRTFALTADWVSIRL